MSTFYANGFELPDGNFYDITPPVATPDRLGGVKPTKKKTSTDTIAISIDDNGALYAPSHPTDAGNKHIPSGGSSGQILGYAENGTATWIDNGFALNGAVGNTIDWNTLTTPGCYKVQMASWGATSLHAPNNYAADLYQYGLLVVMKSNVASENRIIQIYYPHHISYPAVTRMLNSGVWNAWRPLINIVDTLTSTDTTSALSAAQGKALKSLIDGKAASNHTHAYLPTAGGTMGSGAYIQFPDSGNWSNSNTGVTFPVDRGGIKWTGQSDGVALRARETASDNLELELYFTDDNSNGLSILNSAGTKTARILSNGNAEFQTVTASLSGNATTATTATTAGKLSSGTIGSATQPIYFKDGVPASTTYALNKTVPSDAKFTDTTYSNATTSAAGLMSKDDKVKLNGIAAGATNVVVDSALSDSSTNAIQNKIVKAALDGKASSTHTHDYLPLSGGTMTGNILLGSNALLTGETGEYKKSHAIQFGVPNRDYMNFYEYGGIFNFYKHRSGTDTLVGTISESGFSGNSVTASTLKTSRTISLTGGVTGSVSFDGSKNVSISTTLSDFDASKITSGTIDIDRLPKGALERLTVVANNTAKLALTKDSVQNGDTVKLTDTGVMYYVKDDSKLGTEAAFEVYTAGSATSVPWSGVTDKPSSYTPSSHTHNYAGSSSAGGAATSADKLNANAGSATNPVYFSNGVPVKTTYTLGKSVPSDAKFSDTTYSVATTSADGLMSSGDKTKLNGIATGANKTIIDTTLSSTSTNPVQNKVVNNAVTDLYNKLYPYYWLDVSNGSSNLSGVNGTSDIGTIVSQLPPYSKFIVWVNAATTVGAWVYGETNIYGWLVVDKYGSNTVHLTLYQYDSSNTYHKTWSSINNVGWSEWHAGYTTIHSGTGNPSSSLGANGDLYIKFI